MSENTSIANAYIETLARTLRGLDTGSIDAVAALLKTARAEGRHVYVMGNGGSASNASHIQSDLNKSMIINGVEAPRMKAFALNDSVATMLAVANDTAYENIFVEQLKNYLVAGDIVLVLSGSGNSRNVVKAVEYAHTRGARTIAFVGYDGGVLKRTAQLAVHVPIDDMQIVEDIHLALGHMLMKALSQN